MTANATMTVVSRYFSKYDPSTPNDWRHARAWRAANLRYNHLSTGMLKLMLMFRSLRLISARCCQYGVLMVFVATCLISRDHASAGSLYDDERTAEELVWGAK